MQGVVRFKAADALDALMFFMSVIDEDTDFARSTLESTIRYLTGYKFLTQHERDDCIPYSDKAANRVREQFQENLLDNIEALMPLLLLVNDIKRTFKAVDVLLVQDDSIIVGGYREISENRQCHRERPTQTDSVRSFSRITTSINVATWG